MDSEHSSTIVDYYRDLKLKNDKERLMLGLRGFLSVGTPLLDTVDDMTCLIV